MKENRSGFVKFIVSVVVFVLLVGVSLGGYFAVQYVRGKNSPSSFGPELYYRISLNLILNTMQKDGGVSFCVPIYGKTNGC